MCCILLLYMMEAGLFLTTSYTAGWSDLQKCIMFVMLLPCENRTAARRCTEQPIERWSAAEVQSCIKWKYECKVIIPHSCTNVQTQVRVLCCIPSLLPCNSFVFDFSILPTPHCCCLMHVRDQKYSAAMQWMKPVGICQGQYPYLGSVCRKVSTFCERRIFSPKKLDALKSTGCSHFEFMPGEDRNRSMITEWCPGWNHVFTQDPKTCLCYGKGAYRRSSRSWLMPQLLLHRMCS